MKKLVIAASAVLALNIGAAFADAAGPNDIAIVDAVVAESLTGVAGGFCGRSGHHDQQKARQLPCLSRQF